MRVSPALAPRLRALPENRGVEVVEGEILEMPPCMGAATLDDPESFWRKAGRPCPFVDLDEDNDDAATLVLNHIPEHTRPLTPALADAILADLSDDERARTLLRVSLALRSEPVIRKLYPSPDDLK